MGCLTRHFLERLIFAIGDSRRFTQDSPVLPDVWVRYGEQPRQPRDLLLTPDWSSGAGQLASRLRSDIEADKKAHRRLLWGAERPAHGVAYAHATVAVRLTFEELVRLVLPLTGWWHERVADRFARYRAALAEPEVRAAMDAAFQMARSSSAAADEDLGRLSAARRLWTRVRERVPADVFWTASVVGAIACAGRCQAKGDDTGDHAVTAEAAIAAVEELVAPALGRKAADDGEPMVYLVNVNRPAHAAVRESALTVKADAARRLFDVSCRWITWAVIDSGIDAVHPAFHQRDASGRPEKATRADQRAAGDPFVSKTRVGRTYDFTIVRDLLDPAKLTPKSAALPPHVRQVLDAGGERGKALGQQIRLLKQMLNSGREVDWQLLEPLLRVPHNEHYRPVAEGHGTHVAGILGADWREAVDAQEETAAWRARLQGVCPDIRLYDLRVLDEEGGDEFAVIAALQFVRHLNATHDEVKVHGVNLSLEILHDVANYACGRTPVCLEADRLSAAGTVVVAAAGNQGYLRYQTADGVREGYHTVSITDPGNALNVITVGATHRREPHNYGVSYFSSRGPTGDGRQKPDLVAPGEKIRAPLPDEREERMEGTSMAAPHVAGGAALLMARNNELIGRPRRIKQLLCDNTTDLGRERYFQGAGMLDILRAMQAV